MCTSGSMLCILLCNRKNGLTNLVVLSGFLYGVTNFVSITCFTLAAIFFLCVGMTKEKAKADEAKIAAMAATEE